MIRGCVRGMPTRSVGDREIILQAVELHELREAVRRIVREWTPVVEAERTCMTDHSGMYLRSDGRAICGDCGMHWQRGAVAA